MEIFFTTKRAPKESTFYRLRLRSASTLLCLSGLYFALLMALSTTCCRNANAEPDSPDTHKHATNIDAGNLDTRTENIIVLIGASYAQDWDLPGIQGYGIVNQGISGNQTGEMMKRFDEDVIAKNPAAVIIWGFINDIFRGDPERMESVKKVARTNLETMVQMAETNGIVPMVATEVTMRARKGFKEAVMGFLYGTLLKRTSYQEYINGHVTEVNAWLEAFALEKGIVLLDFESVLSNRDGMRRKEFAAEDGSHISSEGYRALTDYVNTHPELKRVVKSLR